MWITEWAPEPRDVHWPNMGMPKWQRGLRRLIVGTAVFLMVRGGCTDERIVATASQKSSMIDCHFGSLSIGRSGPFFHAVQFNVQNASSFNDEIRILKATLAFYHPAFHPGSPCFTSCLLRRCSKPGPTVLLNIACVVMTWVTQPLVVLFACPWALLP